MTFFANSSGSNLAKSLPNAKSKPDFVCVSNLATA